MYHFNFSDSWFVSFLLHFTFYLNLNFYISMIDGPQIGWWVGQFGPTIQFYFTKVSDRSFTILGRIFWKQGFKIWNNFSQNRKISQRDELGYSALHHAAIGGLREVIFQTPFILWLYFLFPPFHTRDNQTLGFLGVLCLAALYT